ncbi:MAG: polyphosphate kinase 2 family protein [Gemmatimonadota bacterium]|nr:polyphosphate kinase 2 family protein [Gemmatimonadota bacterium]
MHLKPVEPDSDLPLRDRDARPPRKAPTGDELEKETSEQIERIGELQRVFAADARHALLIVLQGRDASGKDGTIRHVFGAVNPQGCEVTSFKTPTLQELRHDFLWRVHQRVPERGMFGLFNRSHYEDVLAVRVHRLVPKKVWSARYELINDFERMLTENRVVILKFYLHVSRAEQKKRLVERLTDRTKNWKFSEGDLKERSLWPEYVEAYRDVLQRCSTSSAPWYIVPADDKAHRNWTVARTIVRALEGLELEYPAADPSVLKLASKIE